MLELLQSYSIAEILIIIIMLGLAIKGVVSFFDWAIARLRKVFNKENQHEKEVNSFLQHLNQHDEILKKLSETQDFYCKELSKISDDINLLMSSDKDDISSYITEKHHLFCYEKHWIDDYSLSCLEKRYSHYVEENGNSFIAELMGEIRALPKIPPKE